jgi:MFS family permease
VTFAFSPNRLYWATRGLRTGRLRRRLDGPLATYFLAATLFFTGFAGFWAPLPLFLVDAGVGPSAVFGLYLVSSLASAACYEPAGRLAARFDLGRLQTGAVAARGLSFPVVALAVGLGGTLAGLGATALALLVVGATWAVVAVAGTAVVTRLAAPTVRGEALGVYTALGAVAGGVGGVLGGWVATFGPLVAFGAAGVLVLAGAALVRTVGGLGTDRSVRSAPSAAERAGSSPPPPRSRTAARADDER